MASSDERDVFSALPSTRPQRRSAKRDRGGKGDAPRAGAENAPPQARAEASSKPGAGSARAKSQRPRSAAKPKAAAQPKSPPVPPAGYATPKDDDRPHGADLVGTAVQAAGELAHIGIVFSAKALKSAIQRLPRP
jgi:hypothetical protein